MAGHPCIAHFVGATPVEALGVVRTVSPDAEVDGFCFHVRCLDEEVIVFPQPGPEFCRNHLEQTGLVKHHGFLRGHGKYPCP